MHGSRRDMNTVSGNQLFAREFTVALVVVEHHFTIIYIGELVFFVVMLQPPLMAGVVDQQLAGIHTREMGNKNFPTPGPRSDIFYVEKFYAHMFLRIIRFVYGTHDTSPFVSIY